MPVDQYYMLLSKGMEEERTHLHTHTPMHTRTKSNPNNVHMLGRQIAVLHNLRDH